MKGNAYGRLQNEYKLKDCFIKLTKLPISVGQSVKVLGTITNNSGKTKFEQFSGAKRIKESNAISDIIKKRLNAKIISISPKKGLTEIPKLNVDPSKNPTSSKIGMLRVAEPSTLFYKADQVPQVVDTEADTIHVIDDDDDSQIKHESEDSADIKDVHVQDITDIVAVSPIKTTEKIIDAELLLKRLSQIIGKENEKFLCKICDENFNNKIDCINHVSYHVEMNKLAPFHVSGEDFKLDSLIYNEQKNGAEDLPRVVSPLFIDVNQGFKFLSPPGSEVQLTDESTKDTPVETPVVKVVSPGKNKTEVIVIEYKCIHCNVTFKKLSFLENHMFYCHPSIKPWYYCMWCNEITFNLEGHKHDSTEQRSQCINDESKEENLPPKKHFNFICFYCRETFRLVKSIQNHMRSEHVGVISKYFCCICQKLFLTLQNHTHEPPPIKIQKKSKQPTITTTIIVFPLLESSALETVTSGNPDLKEVCRFCGEVITSEVEYNKHENLYHSNLKTYPIKKEHIQKPETIVQPLEESAETLVSCIMCPEKFESIVDYNNHVRMYHSGSASLSTTLPNDLLYKCTNCNKQFCDKYKILEHVKSDHPTIKRPAYKCLICHKSYLCTEDHTHFDIECRFCKKTFKNPTIRDKHELINHPTIKPPKDKDKKYIYSCLYCVKQFENFCKLGQHVRTEHSEIKHPSYRCIKCCQNYPRMISHVHSINVKCKMCNLVFPDRASREEHVLQSHSSQTKRYICMCCTKSFRRYKTVKQHIYCTHRNIRDRWYKCFKCKENYVVTKSHTHSDEDSDNELKVTENVIPKKNKNPCSFCNECFETTDDMLHHITITHKDVEVVEVDIREDGVEVKQEPGVSDNSEILAYVTPDNDELTECKLCHNLIKKSLLFKHTRVQHPRYSCILCFNIFDTIEEKEKHGETYHRLKYVTPDGENHNMIHTASKDYSCDICKLKFVTQKDLLQHKKLHSNRTKRTCIICNRNYKNMKMARLCKESHLTTRLVYECKECLKTFFGPTAYQNHVELKHEKPFKCLKCNKKFSSEHTLLLHIQKHNSDSKEIEVRESSNSSNAA